MPYKPYETKEEVKEEVQKPNYEVEAAVAKAKADALEAEMKRKGEEWDAREKELSRMKEEYNTPAPQQQQYSQQEQQAIIDLGLSEEEIAANPSGAFNKVQEYLNAIYQENQGTVQRAGQVITGLAEDNHRLKVESLQSEEFYKYAKNDINAFYKKNPEAKIPGTPGYVSPDKVYRDLVGGNWKSYFQEQEEEKAETEPAHTATPDDYKPQRQIHTETPVRPSGGPNIHTDSSKKEVTLSDEETEYLKLANRMEPGLNMTAAEWKAINEGKVRGVPPNRPWGDRPE